MRWALEKVTRASEKNELGEQRYEDYVGSQDGVSETVWIGVDEMNRRKGHNYLTVFADLLVRRVIFATEGKDASTFKGFVEALLAHNGHPNAITQAAIDMSAAYQKGVRDHLPNAQIVFDKFHVVPLVNGAVDEVRRTEAREENSTAKDQLKSSRWFFRKNPENLSQKEQARLEELDLKHMASGVGYQMRLGLQEAYASSDAQSCRHHRKISGRDRGLLATGMFYFVAGKLAIPSILTH